MMLESIWQYQSAQEDIDQRKIGNLRKKIEAVRATEKAKYDEKLAKVKAAAVVERQKIAAEYKTKAAETAQKKKELMTRYRRANNEALEDAVRGYPQEIP